MTLGGDHTSDPLDGAPAGDRRTWPDLPIGVLVSRYITTGVLGRGGMGVVYSAYDPVLRRPVALKLVHSAHPASAGRLIREAQALARLSNPHVVAVYDAGEYESDQVFIAMQHVDGQDLATVLAQRRASRTQILEWFVAAGRGLAAAHAAGLVHRDFKPANVLLDRSGNVAVTDFGLAREVLPNGQARQTNQAALAGTPAYMSPEQLGLMPATQASDQFSFCLALWEALFQQHPFVAGPLQALSPIEIGCAIIEAPLVPPPRAGDAPRRVIDALVRGLERKPTARWPSMPALLAAIAPIPRLRRWPMLAAGLAGAGAATTAALVIAMLDRGGSASAGAPPALTHVPPTSAPDAADLAETASVTPTTEPPSTGPGDGMLADQAHREPSTITLGLTVEPAGAAIAIDGAAVDGTEIVVQKDAAAHLLRITAPGYIEHDAFIKFDESQQLSVQLKRATRTHGTAPDDGRSRPDHSQLIESQSPYR